MLGALLTLVLAVQAGDPPADHVVLISIDGFRPDFVDDGWETPELKAMAKAGARARRAEGVYPSVTYPSHATIVTGVRPNRHGILSNNKWGENGPLPDWHWFARDVKARTLWQAARERKKTVGVAYWPSTVGAGADWMVAEVWDPEGKETLKRLTAASTPGLLPALAVRIGLPKLSKHNRGPLDAFLARSVAHLFGKHTPNLYLVHLIEVDGVQHRDGRESDEVRAAVHRSDVNVGRIRRAIEASGVADRTAVIVTGDHGFADARTRVRPNVRLAEAGLVRLEEGRVVSWRALVKGYGGSAAVYVKDPADVPRVRAILERGTKEMYRVLGREALDKLGYNPACPLALDAGEGYAISGSVDGPHTNREEATFGAHGHLPTRPEAWTGFIAAGAGIRKGVVVEKIRLIDIAPTVAHLLGLEMPDVEGRVLGEILDH